MATGARLKSSERGLAFLPLLAANWQLVAIGLLVAAAGAYALHCESVKRDHATFVAKLEAQAEEQTKRAKATEAANAKKLTDALSERDAARKRLRSQSRPISLSDNSASPDIGATLCIGTSAYNAAMGEFRKSLERGVADARGNATAGDEAQIDAKACVEAWPK